MPGVVASQSASSLRQLFPMFRRCRFRACAQFVELIEWNGIIDERMYSRRAIMLVSRVNALNAKRRTTLLSRVQTDDLLEFMVPVLERAIDSGDVRLLEAAVKLGADRDPEGVSDSGCQSQRRIFSRWTRPRNHEIQYSHVHLGVGHFPTPIS